MKIAVVGATGVVGQKMLQVLEERGFDIHTLIPVASERSAGKTIAWCGKNVTIKTVDEALSGKPDLAIFSAGSHFSKENALRFTDQGCTVIDNSSAWRMHSDVKLIIPEINGEILTKKDKLIANPNCSTIQLVQVLWPLHRAYGVKRVIVSTYQSVTGSGLKGINQLESEKENHPCKDPAYPHPIELNCLPHGGDFDSSGYTSEEKKLINESRKILGLPDLRITGTVVRVPVKGGHSESVNISFDKKPDVREVRKILSSTPGITVQDEPAKNIYPMPVNAEGKDETFVGRIREDDSFPNSLNLWVVSDNLRKGAATNSIQIAEYLINQGYV
ncbi:MAG: aspartate-semialdehyde dehydrogenase [Candidatus Delongbacteria bacterium]|jgi:aspartate-semialdehyde dehydrogenase|nr:aspartate-semialdehyde dehydrogenase [Candidatus Delongbacteria bacterium]